STRLRRVLALVGPLVVAVAAFAVLDRVMKNPADTLTGALGRWDHWILCALVGQLLVLVEQRWKIRALVLLSLVFVGTYAGSGALALTLGAGLAGWAAIRYGLGRWPRAALAVQPCVTLGVVVYLLGIRPSDQFLALRGWGLACWAMMRHVSFVVE